MTDSASVKDMRFYGRRYGKKLRKSRLLLMETLLPLLRIDIPEQNTRLSPSDLFPEKKKAFSFEVGFGGGEHLAEQAKRNPDEGFIGSEVFVNGIASVLSHLAGSYKQGITEEKEVHLEEGRKDNVRIFPEDARKLLPLFEDASFDRIYVLFPDPWPKNRHASRRFICKENLDIISRLLKNNGLLRVASDDRNYIDWTLMQTVSHEDFTWAAEKADDWRIPPKDWASTRYEKKAIKQGRKPAYLDFIRKSRS